jgi:hypothetical protein
MSAGIAAVLLSLAPSGAGQDFGRDWIDRVSHELQQERGPLKEMPAAFTGTAGLAYYHDSNVFLEETGKDADSVLIPFVRGRVDYAEPRLEAAADLLVNYKIYFDQDDSSDDEERFFGKARLLGTSYTVELAEVLRRESDPIDALFLDRQERLVSNTLPRVVVDLSEDFALEGSANLQVVRFADDPYARQVDNLNYRADLALVLRTVFGYDLLAQAGAHGILYSDEQSAGAPPDAAGTFLRAGFRGEPLALLVVEAFAGYAEVESDPFVSTGAVLDDSSMDIGIHARYEFSPTVTLVGDYSRLFTFAGASDPYQLINRARASLEHHANDQLTLRGRAQVDHVDSALGVKRDYTSLSASASWKFSRSVIADVGATWRAGRVEPAGGAAVDFEGFLFQLGAAITY